MLAHRLVVGSRRYFASATASTHVHAPLSPEIQALLETFRSNPRDATTKLLQEPADSLPEPAALEHVVTQLFRGKHTKEALDILQMSLDRSVGVDFSIAIRKSGALDRQDSKAVLAWLHENVDKIDTNQHVSMIRVCLRLKHFSSAVHLFELIRHRSFNGRDLSKDVMHLLAAAEAIPNGRLRYDLQTKILRFHTHPNDISAIDLIVEMCQRQPDAASHCIQWAIGAIYWRSNDDWPIRVAQIESIFATALARGVVLVSPMRFSMIFAKCRDHDLDPERLVHVFLAMVGQNLVVANESSCMAAIHACQNFHNYALALTLFKYLKDQLHQPMTSRLYNTGLYSAAKSGNEATAANLAAEMLAANVKPDKRSLVVVQSLAASPTSMGLLTKCPQLVEFLAISNSSIRAESTASPRQHPPLRKQPSSSTTVKTDAAPQTTPPVPAEDSKSCTVM
ncbi:hypothetical protein H310_07718 [Aphanomyces invadans]|uniref:Pentacotripeptide-repeat region of PRORP domain-containing protein n=1 Tax=Aphanomyces invadans TaxID=157072 RepID=A0A024U094_9STRA|nr:hypothetical protein H310_07718 [Aphanomyces invadans]ETV99649.1 hypothetical protein H310_07718 [Aphanomyces invadans]|eukprot:XP_008871425.1 hypothetical protein H310_07718 [Aphanomyces invadans]